MKRYAGAIASPSLADAEKNRSATWIGTIFGFYAADGGGKTADVIRNAQPDVRAKLPDAQKPAFDKGQAEGKGRLAKSREEVEAVAKEASEDAEQKLRKLNNDLDSFKNAAERKKEGLKRTQEQWGKIYEEQLKVVNDMMRVLALRDQELRATQRNLNQTPAITERGADRISRAVLDLEVKISLNMNDAQQLIDYANQLRVAYMQAARLNIAENQNLKDSVAKLEKVAKVKEKNSKKKAESKKEILERHMNDVKVSFPIDLKEYAGQLLLSLEPRK